LRRIESQVQAGDAEQRLGFFVRVAGILRQPPGGVEAVGGARVVLRFVQGGFRDLKREVRAQIERADFFSRPGGFIQATAGHRLPAQTVMEPIGHLLARARIENLLQPGFQLLRRFRLDSFHHSTGLVFRAK
jgi:hypothetical protein